VKKGSVHSLRKCIQIPKTHKPLLLIHWDNARVHTARATQERLDVSRFKRTPQLPYSPGIAPSDFFLFGLLKTQLEQREYNGADELYEAVDDILTDLSIEMIETVFVHCMNRLQSLVDGNGDYVSQNITSEFLN
jgi:hypothetical protein